jgi:hypothetical protein
MSKQGTGRTEQKLFVMKVSYVLYFALSLNTEPAVPTPHGEGLLRGENSTRKLKIENLCLFSESNIRNLTDFQSCKVYIVTEYFRTV